MELFKRLFGNSDKGKQSFQGVRRTFENLPSMAMVPLPASFQYPVVCRMITAEAADKDLVCLVHLGWTASEADAFRVIELTWEFAEDPKLVALCFSTGDQIIIRASFMKTTAAQVTASTISQLAIQMTNLAKARGMLVKTAA